MDNKLYIGNYSEDGIDVLENKENYIIKSKLGNDKNTSYIVKNKNFLYSVIETADIDTNSGYVVAYDIKNDKTINSKESCGADPCFLNVDILRNILYVCNYTRRVNCSIQIR